MCALRALFLCPVTYNYGAEELEYEHRCTTEHASIHDINYSQELYSGHKLQLSSYEYTADNVNEYTIR